jgi:type VI secretion system protein ImpL
VVLLNEPGKDGLKKMVEAAQRKRRDGGVFELSWTNSGVVVTANLKLVGTQTATPAPVPVPGRGMKGLRLPESIIGAAPVAATAPIAAAATPGAAQ